VNLFVLAGRSGQYHWRTNLAVVLGVAAAVSVLAGALVVGDSVRGSLRDLALGRLGRTDYVVSALGFFREAAADDVRSALKASRAAPMIVADGFVTLESSGRRASNVLVYGVDQRFWGFHGLENRDGVFVSPALAVEVGAREGDVLLTRLQRPSEIPVESLFGRKEEVGRTVRLTLAGVLPRDRLGEFALKPQQAEVRAVFAPIRRIQRDLGVSGQVNTVLVAGGERTDTAFRSAFQLEDLGVRIDTASDPPAVIIESASGIVSDTLGAAAHDAAVKLNLQPIPVFTYLANSIRSGDRQIPYSLITATDLTQLAASRPPSRTSNLPRVPPSPGLRRGRADARLDDHARAQADGAAGEHPPIVLNQWAAKELSAGPGDSVEIDYYLWDPAAGLTTHTASFQVERVVPIAGLTADRRLTPQYPGITGANSLADWDPPFPIDLSRVRPIDERYWNEYRTTPKAFVPYEQGRDLWRSRYGALTSIRVLASDTEAATKTAGLLDDALRATLSPAAMGMTLFPVRAAALDGAQGATDFGQYFTYFSFFLVISALLLAVIFFKLGIEQRLHQIGILRASGYTMMTVRWLLLGEALLLAILGAVIGVVGALAYGQLIVYGLRTWWVGAVGTTMLELHVRPVSLAIGAAAGVLAATLCVLVSLRTVNRMSPRSLLTATSLDVPVAIDPRRARRNRLLASLFALAGVGLIGMGFAMPSMQAGAFFGAGAALLVGMLLWLAGWLRARDARLIAGRGSWAVVRLGFRSAAFRPGRSVLSAALIASAAFIIVSVDAFRREGGELTADPKAGTGGYVLFAESEIPLLHNPNDATGRQALMIQSPDLARTRFTRFRVRPGEDASCLNLYRPTNPTIIAAENEFIGSGRFTFAASMAESDAERLNPWLLLRRRFDDGAVPVVADATSMQYVLHVAVGDTLSMDTGGDKPLVLRFVGALRDSVLQGELVIAEEQFVRLFPQQQGYRLFLVDAPGVDSIERANQLAGIVEQELLPFGVDATPTSERLASFHRVENTYLSTFQALGGLGLLLGTIGLATVMFRNVLERRRELALLRAVGYDRRSVSMMILAEAGFLLIAGVLAGAGSAAVAIAPAWLGRSGSAPGVGLGLLLAAVVAAGVLSSLVATRAALSGKMLEALRAE
jgi:putative ABC transport system permease protein